MPAYIPSGYFVSCSILPGKAVLLLVEAIFHREDAFTIIVISEGRLEKAVTISTAPN